MFCGTKWPAFLKASSFFLYGGLDGSTFQICSFWEKHLHYLLTLQLVSFKQPLMMQYTVKKQNPTFIGIWTQLLYGVGSAFKTHSKKQSQGPQGPDLGEVILDTLKPAFLEDVWHSKDCICSIASLHVCTTTGWRRGISIGQTTVQKMTKKEIEAMHL